MSNPKYYWYTFVRYTIYRYPDRLGKGKQAELAREAIRKALADVTTLPDGDDRLKFLQLTMFGKSYTYYGAARVIGLSESTARRWASSFIYAVARNMGFETK